MERVYSSLNSMLVDNLHNVLQQEGIDCQVRNRSAGSALGETPFTEAYAELWVHDEQVPVAADRIREALRDSDPAEGRWVCTQCGEQIERSFGSCWKCARAGDQGDRKTDPHPLIDRVGQALGSTKRRTWTIVWAGLFLVGVLMIARLIPW